MVKQIHQSIIENPFVLGRCRKLLGENGINSPCLIINKLPQLYDEINIKMASARIQVPKIGYTASIAKNLDEYQYLICSEISHLPDRRPIKLELQKYRISIIASFAKLVAVLKTFSSNDEVGSWNSFAKSLLAKTSETLVLARRNQNAPRNSFMDSDLLSALNYFGIAEKDLERDLALFYTGRCSVQ
jgi:hypothetical protein